MKIKLAMWMKEASGSDGEAVFRQVNGKTIMSKKPRKSRKPYTEAQRAVHKRFRAARDYANYVSLNSDLLPRYQEAVLGTKTSVYMLCRRDWYNPPEIDEIKLLKYKGQVGDVIRFTVHDEIGAEAVTVALSDNATGNLIEQGEAVEEYVGSGHWMYTATQAVPSGTAVAVEVLAWDHPGNVGEAKDIKQV
jgi:hypothetical protein